MTPTMAFALGWLVISTVVTTGSLPSGPEEALGQHWNACPAVTPAMARSTLGSQSLRHHTNEVVVSATVCPRQIRGPVSVVTDGYRNDAFPAAVAVWPNVKGAVVTGVEALPTAVADTVRPAVNTVLTAFESNHDRIATIHPAWLTHHMVALQTDAGNVVVTDVGASVDRSPTFRMQKKFDTSGCFSPHTFTSLVHRRTVGQVEVAAAAWFKAGHSYSAASVFAMMAGLEGAFTKYSCQSYAMGVLTFVGARDILASTYGGTGGMADMILLPALALACLLLALAYKLVATRTVLKATTWTWATSVAAVTALYLACIGVCMLSLPQYNSAITARMVACVTSYLAVVAGLPYLVALLAAPPAAVADMLLKAGGAGFRKCTARAKSCAARALSLARSGVLSKMCRVAHALCTPARVSSKSIYICRRRDYEPPTWFEHRLGQMVGISWRLAAASGALWWLHTRAGLEVAPLATVRGAAIALAWTPAAMLGFVVLTTLLALLSLMVGLCVDLVAKTMALVTAVVAAAMLAAGVAWFAVLWCASRVMQVSLAGMCTTVVAAGVFVLAATAVVFQH